VQKQNLEQKLEGFGSTRLKKWLGFILLFALIAFFVVVGLYRNYFDGEIIADHQRWGTFGDYVGGVLNPFFSFLALLALLYTIILQNHQLEVSKQELIASRKELELTRKQTILTRIATIVQNQVASYREEIFVLKFKGPDQQ
jgi:hypothetical protein